MRSREGAYWSGEKYRVGWPPNGRPPERVGSRGSAPVASFMVFAEELNNTRGHENAGFLSMARGFLPRSDPSLALPSSHQPWDELARALPNLYAEGTFRKVAGELPVLSAREADLDDAHLLRAAALLAILCHAYWYCLPSAAEVLPVALEKPWRELRRRLGRPHEVITYIDLIVYNWRRKDAQGPLVVDNLSLLFPTIGNQEEQVFYLTQLEILAKSSELLRNVVAAQTAVCDDDAAALERALGQLISGLRDVVQKSLPKISGNSRHEHYVDAIVWAKSVAPFAVPARKGVQGPSGTSSPIFNTLDLFFGRGQYASFLGREIRELRSSYPVLWRAMLRRVQRVQVEPFVRTVGSSSLTSAWEEALAAYAGEGGFLGRHRIKVYGFLELAFKVGRSLTIGGFGGVFQDRTWDEVDDELESSRLERFGAAPAQSGLVRTEVTTLPNPSPKNFYLSEVSEHTSQAAGYWLAISGVVYDISRFRSLHPGGERILDAYAGMDATHGFRRVHSARADIEAMLTRFRIGELVEPALDPGEFSVLRRGNEAYSTELNLYRAYARALNLSTEMVNALRMDLSFGHLPVHAGRPSAPPSPYQVARLAETHERFLVTQLGVVVRETLPRLGLWTDSFCEALGMKGAQAGAGPFQSQSGLEDRLERQISLASLVSREVGERVESGTLDEQLVRSIFIRGAADLELLGALQADLRCCLRAFESYDTVYDRAAAVSVARQQLEARLLARLGS